MSMEILESRIAPAGIVNIEISGGVLKLAGDDAGAEIIIEQISPKTFQITGIDTQLQGPDGLVSELILSKVSSIVANFGDGNDTLEIWDATLKSLSLNLGGTADDGTNKATINSSKTTGATQLLGGSGNDTVTFDGLSWSSASVQSNLGEGNNGLYFRASKVTLGAVHVVGGSERDTFSAIGTSVTAKDVKFELGEGNNTISLNAPKFTLSNLNVLGGSGTDTFTSTADNLTVNGSATLSLGSGNNPVTISGTTAKIKGDLSITRGDHGGASTSKITLTTGGVFSVGKNLSIDHGTGLFATTINAGTLTVKGSFSVQQNAGSTSTASTLTVDSGTTFSVGKNLSVQNGAGRFTTTITSSVVTAGGDMSLKDAGLADSTHNSSVIATTSLTVKGDLIVAGADGRHDTSLYGGSVFKVAGNTIITQGNAGGSGRAEIAFSSDGDVQFKTVELRSKKPQNQIGFFAANVATRGISYEGGTGALSLDFEANVIQTKGNITFDSTGPSELTMESLDLLVTGDIETSGPSVLWLTPRTGKINGDVTTRTVNIDAMKSLTIGGNLEAREVGGGTLSNIARAIVRGNTTITAGDTMSIIGVMSSQFFGAFNLTTGTDLDILTIDGGLPAGKGSQFYGPVTINTGEGNNELSIGIPDSGGAPTFHNTVTLAGGTGTNQLKIGSNVVFKKGTPDTATWTVS